MLRAVSTYLFVKERLHPGILDGLTRSGVQSVKIFAARQHIGGEAQIDLGLAAAGDAVNQNGLGRFVSCCRSGATRGINGGFA